LWPIGLWLDYRYEPLAWRPVSFSLF
jgi:hypothetical protein